MAKARVLLPTEHVVLLFQGTAGDDLSQGLTFEVADDKMDATLEGLESLGLMAERLS